MDKSLESGSFASDPRDSEVDDHEAELTIKFIKLESGQPPRGVDVQVTLEDHELGSYPVISVIWDDSIRDYPDEYIGKCTEAFDRFNLSEEIHEWYRRFFDLQDSMQKLVDSD